MNILIIPHSPEYKNIHNRCHEIALGLVRDGDLIYFLEWETCPNRSIFTLLKAQLINFFYPRRLSTKNKIIYIRWPAVNVKRGSLFFSKINSLLLNILINIYDIKCIINSNINYYNFQYLNSDIKIFDIVDDHFNENKSIGITQDLINLQKLNILNASKVTAITDLIASKVFAHTGIRNVHVIGNGFYPSKFDLVTNFHVESLKTSLNISNKFIFGYVGNIDHWVRLELALEAFNVAFDGCGDVIFLVVGGSPNAQYYSDLKNKYSSLTVQFLGPVSKDIVANYFKVLDVGLIPFELSDFTNNAFPIKALEYGYSGCHVLSSKLSFFDSNPLSFHSFF